MNYFEKIKINLDYYDLPVEVQPFSPRSVKVLKKIKKFEIHPILREILKHPEVEIYDIDPEKLIIKNNKLISEIGIGLNKRNIIENFDKFEINESGKVKKINIKIDTDKVKRKIKEFEEDDPSLQINPKKRIKNPGIH
jgi:predicted nucleotidyltransferase